MIHILGNVLIYLSAIPAVLFVYFYHRTARWWVSEMGCHLMSFMAVEAAVLVLSSIRITFGDSPPFQLLRLVVFLGVPFVLWWRLKLLIFSQLRRPKEAP